MSNKLWLVYRHPGENFSHFIKDTETSLNASDKKRCCIFCGDININIINYEGDNELNYLSMLLSHRYMPFITLPTRITFKTATCIDHIFMRQPNLTSNIHAKSGLIYCDITDHLPCFISIKNETQVRKVNRPLTRIFGLLNCQKYVIEMETFNWNDLYNQDDDWFSNFLIKLIEQYNHIFP